MTIVLPEASRERLIFGLRWLEEMAFDGPGAADDPVACAAAEDEADEWRRLREIIEAQ